MKKRTKTKTKTQPVVIRNYRDTLFRMLYRNKKRLLSLFNAVNGTQYDNPDDLTITTLEGVLYLGMKNDVSCIIDMMMQLYEHQSTVNPNMPLRNLFYVSDLLQKYIYEEGIDIYSRKQIKIPTPKFVVFYNGDRNQKEYWEMHLSDAFPEGVKVNIDLRVRVYNINYGKNSKLLQQTKLLSGYSYFVDKIKHLCKNGSELKEAIDTAVRECIKEGVLTDQLTYLGSEVMGMFATEFDMDEAVKVWKEEAREEGLEEGREEGRKQGIREGRLEGQSEGRLGIIKNYLENGGTVEQARELLKATEEEIQKVTKEM